MAYTQLSPMALPGPTYTFSAKDMVIEDHVLAPMIRRRMVPEEDRTIEVFFDNRKRYISSEHRTFKILR